MMKDNQVRQSVTRSIIRGISLLETLRVGDVDERLLDIELNANSIPLVHKRSAHY